MPATGEARVAAVVVRAGVVRARGDAGDAVAGPARGLGRGGGKIRARAAPGLPGGVAGPPTGGQRWIMHRNATRRDGPWPPSVRNIARAVPSRSAWPRTRMQARCAARLIRGDTLNADAAICYGPGGHRGPADIVRVGALRRLRTARGDRGRHREASKEKIWARAGSSRAGVGRLGVGVSRLAVPGQVERRDEPLSLRS